ncbi:MAG: PorT family protein [Mediterranea sp.]|jgi:hypothetical protein|nr:PorT family protein [Mediterranea sp.]
MQAKSIIGLGLWLFSATVWGQVYDARTPRSGETVNFGIKGGFTSTLLWVSDLAINNISIKEIQNNYQIGYFGSFFMRINFDRHFLQPEISYTVNRCNITFEKPQAEGIRQGTASITSSIHSIDIPVIYGYNIVKEGPYGMAVFGGPKLHYFFDNASKITFENFDHQNIDEELYPFNLSLTMGVAVTISRIFFDFRYDIGLHNLSRRITYTRQDETIPADELRFRRRDNVLSFSMGMFF